MGGMDRMDEMDVGGDPSWAVSMPSIRSMPSTTSIPNAKKKKGTSAIKLKSLILVVAGPMGLEPTASGVTGRRYNRLNYDPAWSFGGRYRDRTYDIRLVRPTLSQLS